MDIVVGTAGHIDHGKTALVKALTGVDADRLPEEKQRGITIDLGFAELELEGVRIGFVDVPGHERFVKNMLAGAGGIDLVMLVVAADEGVMPQTREHFEICRLLQTSGGIVALTKTDLADAELLDLVELDIAELVEGSFLENAPVMRVSSKTGEGLDDLKEQLRELASGVPARNGGRSARLAIDRSFSIKGFGAVATGTLTDGEIRIGDDLELLPSGKRVRVRGVQTHGRQVEGAHAGQRTAVNLGGVDQEDVSRGMVLAAADSLFATQIFDAQVEVLEDSPKPLRSRQRVRVHLGTAEALARLDVLNESRSIEPGASDLVQVRLEMPAVAAPGDRFIIRRYSPQITIAGGLVLDSGAAKHRRKEISSAAETLRDLSEKISDPVALCRFVISASGLNGCLTDDLRRRTGLRTEVIAGALEKLGSEGLVVQAERRQLSGSAFREFCAQIESALTAHHSDEPLSTGLPKETLRERTAAHLPPEVFRAALAALEKDGTVALEREIVRLASHSRELSEAGGKILKRLSDGYASAGLEVPAISEAIDQASAGTGVSKEDARRIFQMLVDSSEVVKVSEDLYFNKTAIDGLVGSLRKYAETAENRLITVPEFKDLAGISRKYAIPLLEYLDAVKVTRRAGDKRLIL